MYWLIVLAIGIILIVSGWGNYAVMLLGAAFTIGGLILSIRFFVSVKTEKISVEQTSKVRQRAMSDSNVIGVARDMYIGERPKEREPSKEKETKEPKQVSPPVEQMYYPKISIPSGGLVP